MASPVAEAAELQGSAVAVDMELLPLARMASLAGWLAARAATSDRLLESSVSQCYPPHCMFVPQAITQKEKIDREGPIFFRPIYLLVYDERLYLRRYLVAAVGLEPTTQGL